MLRQLYLSIGKSQDMNKYISTNFGALEEKDSLFKNSKIVIIPVPYDETSTWIKGSDSGPDAIIQASANMELYDIETRSEVYKNGIFTAPPITEKSSPEKMVEAVELVVEKYLNNGFFPVVIGGEHSVSIGAIKAICGKHEDISILQLDAHADLRDEYEGSKFNHACVMARAKECCHVVQVGIRSCSIEESKQFDPKNVFFAGEIDSQDNKEQSTKLWAEKITSRLSKNVYITIDLDVFDPSIMPSVGTPEPGGLLWNNVLTLLNTVCQERNIVGFDVVELCPNKINKSSDFAAAKLIYKLLSYKFKDK
jgi:agmatinase